MTGAITPCYYYLMPTKEWLDQRRALLVYFTREEYADLAEACRQKERPMAAVVREMVQNMLSLTDNHHGTDAEPGQGGPAA